MSRVLTIGTFDLFHYGHLNLLREARKLGFSLTVGVNDSEFVETFKGVTPLHSNAERMANVRSLRFVEDAFVHYGRDFIRDDLTRWYPNVIAIVDDWQDLDYLGQLGVTQDWLDRRGIRVAYLPRTPGVSSTLLRSGPSD